MIHDVDQLLEQLVKTRRPQRLVGRARLRRADEGLGRPAQRPGGRPLPVRHPRGPPAAGAGLGGRARTTTGEVKDRRLPPRRFRLAYLVTAWTQRPEDEHRLLSALLGCFIRNAMLKPEELEGALAEADLPVYIDVAQPPSQDRSLADVWSALGGELKPSLDVVVTAPMIVGQSSAVRPAGPRSGRRSGSRAIGGPDGGRQRRRGRQGRGARAAGWSRLPEETVPEGRQGRPAGREAPRPRPARGLTAGRHGGDAEAGRAARRRLGPVGRRVRGRAPDDATGAPSARRGAAARPVARPPLRPARDRRGARPRRRRAPPRRRPRPERPVPRPVHLRRPGRRAARRAPADRGSRTRSTRRRRRRSRAIEAERRRGRAGRARTSGCAGSRRAFGAGPVRRRAAARRPRAGPRPAVRAPVRLPPRRRLAAPGERRPGPGAVRLRRQPGRRAGPGAARARTARWSPAGCVVVEDAGPAVPDPVAARPGPGRGAPPRRRHRRTRRSQPLLVDVASAADIGDVEIARPGDRQRACRSSTSASGPARRARRSPAAALAPLGRPGRRAGPRRGSGRPTSRGRSPRPPSREAGLLRRRAGRRARSRRSRAGPGRRPDVRRVAAAGRPARQPGWDPAWAREPPLLLDAPVATVGRAPRAVARRRSTARPRPASTRRS